VRNDLALMTVQRVIIHEVPRHSRGDDGEGPILSEIDSPLDADLKNYLKERVTGSLKSSQAFDIVIDPMAKSPVPQLVIDYTSPSTGANFVAVSRRMAEHLYAIQTGNNPAGLLAVIDCSVDSLPALGILKLEKEKGARIAHQDLGGKKTYNIRILRDLILTEKTKVFKIGLFVRTGAPVDSFASASSDHQRGLFHRMEVADFFLRRFLGCKLTEEPEVSTKRFFDATEEFINQHVDDPVRRAKYHNHLVSALTSENVSVSPRKFAEDYLRTGDRQRFLTFLESQHAPTAQFMLATSLVKSRLEKVEYRFRDGVSIVTPAEPEVDKIKLTKLESGEVRAEVQGFLDLVRGKG
jgi:37-kD nucleoid-associated bacterial protein